MRRRRRRKRIRRGHGKSVARRGRFGRILPWQNDSRDGRRNLIDRDRVRKRRFHEQQRDGRGRPHAIWLLLSSRLQGSPFRRVLRRRRRRRQRWDLRRVLSSYRRIELRRKGKCYYVGRRGRSSTFCLWWSPWSRPANQLCWKCRDGNWQYGNWRISACMAERGKRQSDIRDSGPICGNRMGCRRRRRVRRR